VNLGRGNACSNNHVTIKMNAQINLKLRIPPDRKEIIYCESCYQQRSQIINPRLVEGFNYAFGRPLCRLFDLSVIEGHREMRSSFARVMSGGVNHHQTSSLWLPFFSSWLISFSRFCSWPWGSSSFAYATLDMGNPTKRDAGYNEWNCFLRNFNHHKF